MTERRRRFERDPSPPGLVLTPRDAAIILACYEHQWLTREQLQRITGIGGITRMNQRLRQLYDHGYLHRIRAGTVGAGLQPVYSVGDKSGPLLGAETERPIPEIREHLREDARASALLLPHDLQVNDVRIALTAAIRNDPHLRLDCWLNTRESYDAYASGRALRPDAYFRFWQEDLLHAFYLEIDRGTTNLVRWATKIDRYVQYRDGGFYAARFGLQRFRVLTVAASPERLSNLKKTTERLAQRSFWFALTNEVIADATFHQPIWWRVGERVQRTLVQP